MRKILCIGYGSIGSRHVSNLLEFDEFPLSIFVVSKRIIKLSSSQHYIAHHTSLDSLKSEKFSHAIISNESSKHLETLKMLLQMGIENIYIEKPLGTELSYVEEITKDLYKKSARVYVGFDLRESQILSALRQILNQGELGRILSVIAFVGQDLTTWRSNIDYRQSSSAKAISGGGVLLDLIHEIDYTQWLFGNPINIFAVSRNSGSLDIDTEDIADIIFYTDQEISVNIHLDYHQPELERNMKISCTNGTYIVDFVANTITSKTKGTCKLKTINFYEKRNDRFKSVIHRFIKNELEKSNLPNFKDGLESLKTVIRIKQQQKNFFNT